MLAGLVLVAVVGSAMGAGRWGRSWCAPLAASSVVWLLVDKHMEGPVLIEITPKHGLVAADLAGIAGLALAGLVAVFESSR